VELWIGGYLFEGKVSLRTLYIIGQERIFVMPMQRNEAITYLKELLNVCSNMSPKAVSFESNPNSQSTDYRVHIKGSIYDADKQMVKDIAKKHSFSVKEESDEVIIYKPYHNQRQLALND
jgi:hypothetical protein